MAEDLDPKLIRTKDMPIISQEIDVTLYDRLISTHQVTESTRATTGIPIGLLAQRFLSQDVIGTISSKNRFGTEVPDPDLGTDGDLYFRLSGETVNSVYVKLNGAWIILALGDDNWSNFLAGRPFDLISMDAESVAAYAFANNTSIRNVVMPSCLNVYDYGFASSSIKELQMENVEHIWPHAFEKCYGIKGVIDLQKCKYIDESAFENSHASGSAGGCQVVLRDAITIGDSAFYESNLFQRSGADAIGLYLPNCTHIYDHAFGRYDNRYQVYFREINLPSIEYIGTQAFRQVELSTLTVRLGPNCANLNAVPFYHCPLGNWTFHISAEVPPILVTSLSEGTTEDLVKPLHIYVPSNSVQAYKDDPVWGKYATVIEADPEEVIE